MEYDDRLARRARAADHGDLSVNVRRLLPRPGPKMAVGVLWWVFGLYALFLARAPYTPTIAEEGLYADLMQQAVFSEEASEAQKELSIMKKKLDEVHVFGWRWRSPYDKMVPPRLEAVNEARSRFEAAMREREALQSDAKVCAARPLVLSLSFSRRRLLD